MDPALETLFYPFETAALNFGGPDNGVLFLNAQAHPALRKIPARHLTLQQYFKPDAAALQDDGFGVTSLPENIAPPYDLALIRAPKSKPETQYLLALACEALNEGGTLVIAAANDAGGKTLSKLAAELGLENINQDVKNKCRVVWGTKPAARNPALDTWLAAGKMQPVLNGRFLSQPGMFGWDKIDRGSDILTRHLPENLSGEGADFGCGYGYLSRHILEISTPASLLCLDADFRALKAAQENLKNSTTPVRYLWEDLGKPSGAASALDWIVMNPPFHEGKNTDTDIGLAFIKNAAAALKPGGALYMVANIQLPYEAALSQYFTTAQKLYEGEGFKIFKAVK